MNFRRVAQYPALKNFLLEKQLNIITKVWARLLLIVLLIFFVLLLLKLTLLLHFSSDLIFLTSLQSYLILSFLPFITFCSHILLCLVGYQAYHYRLISIVCQDSDNVHDTLFTVNIVSFIYEDSFSVLVQQVPETHYGLCCRRWFCKTP